ncbi:MAG: response regulator [Bdellovibrionota bacterium]
MAYNVLLVDDSAIVRKVLIKTFGMTEIPVNQFYQAENGQVGLDILKDNWIDVVFLDINMPVMNGMQFIEKLRGDPTTKDLPVIVVSTEGSKERKAELAEKGIQAYLRKPVSPEALVETISDIFGGIHRE